MKPENVFMGDQLAKIADFGFAGKLVQGEFQNSYLGTENYICPEI